MPRSPERPSMDMLKMSRQEVAAVPLLGRPNLSEEKILSTARIVDQAIQAQFPGSKESERPRLVTDLARRLGNPQPQIAATRLRLLYEKKRQGETTCTDDDGGPDEPAMSRGSLRNHLER